MNQPLTLVYIGAHPDDETVLAGATLHLFAKLGHPVHVVCATRGEGGELGEPPIVDDRAKLGAARENELRCACEKMGITQLHLLDYVDPTVGADNQMYPFTEDIDELKAKINVILDDTQADIVLTHGSNGEYGHPAHILLHQVVKGRVEERANGLLLYTTAAMLAGAKDHLLNQDDPAHLLLDIAELEEAKLAAALCHQSQHALFKRALKVKSIREAMRHESYHRHYPAVLNGDIPQDKFSAVMLANGATQPNGV